MLDNIIFWSFAILAVFSALGVVFHRSIIYAALFLIVVFMSIAGFFLLNNADFLAMSQIIVYGVGLTIVLLFGIMFTGDRSFQDNKVPKRHVLAYAFVSVFMLALLLRTGFHGFDTVAPSPQLVNMLQTEGSTRLLGFLLFKQYALPFELASVLLLVAMIGAIVIAQKKFTDDGDHGDLVYDFQKGRSVTAEAEETLKKQIAQHELPEENEETTANAKELTGVK